MADDILKDARDMFDESASDTAEMRKMAEHDIKFARLADQWPEDVAKQRREEHRPMLTINREAAFIRQVVNAGRQSRRGIIVSPVDGGADEDTAQIISGLIRSIERQSSADVAYDTALDNSVTCGMGFFRIGIDYAHEDSFEMRALIERIPNPLQVHWDTRSTKFDASDWEYGFISDWLSEATFEARYPKSKAVSFEGDAEDAHHWAEDDMVRVAEYWRRTEGERDLYLLSNGETVRSDRLPEIGKVLAGGAKATEKEYTDLAMQSFAERGVEIVRTRKAKYHEVMRRIVSGVEVLEESVWPGTMIPICPVWGEEVFSEGKRWFRSLVRDLHGPQMMINFNRSAATELVALAPRAPWLVEQGAIPKGEEEVWRTANTRSHAYLMYTRGSQQPRRVEFAGVPSGAIQEALNAADDMKAITGIYDASLGARSNETSGVAINSRKRESDNGNFHFLDNLSRGIKYCGQCLVEIIPSVYSERETLRILGDDMKEKVVKMRSGDKLYDMSVGRYDVTVRAGPSSETEREEARQGLIEIMDKVPGAANLVADVLLDQMDFPQAEVISKRMKSLLPPQVAQAESGEDEMSPAHMAAMQQMQQQMGQMQQQLAAASQAAQTAGHEKQMAERKAKLEEDKLQFEKQKYDADRLERTNGVDLPNVLPAIAGIREELSAVASAILQSMNAPVSITRDQAGNVISFNKGGRRMRVVPGPDGRIAGVMPEGS